MEFFFNIVITVRNYYCYPQSMFLTYCIWYDFVWFLFHRELFQIITESHVWDNTCNIALTSMSLQFVGRLARCLLDVHRPCEAYKVIVDFEYKFPGYVNNSARRALKLDIIESMRAGQFQFCLSGRVIFKISLYIYSFCISRADNRPI